MQNEPINTNDTIKNDEGLAKYYGIVYRTMACGVGVTALIAWLLAYPLRTPFLKFATSNSWMFFIIAFVPLILIIIMGRNVNDSTPSSTNFVIFMIMSAMFGVTTSISMMAGSTVNVVSALIITSIIFLLMSFVGRNTKNDLQSGRRTVSMLLLAVILVSVLNMFFASSMLGWILNYAILGIFTWLVASDQQNIKQAYYAMESQGATKTLEQNYAVYSAIGLYLDFLNIFMVLLDIFSGSNNNRN